MYYVFLKDEVACTKGFITTTLHDRSVSHQFRLAGGNCIGLYRKGDRWHSLLGQAEEEVPSALVPFVDEISFMGDIPAEPHREYGVYRHESARAQVTKSPGKAGGKAHVVGKNIADVRGLYHRILAGSIRPDESYEGSQVGMSRKELEEALDKLQVGVKRLYCRIVGSYNLGPRWWPWCRRQKVLDAALGEINWVLRSNGINVS